MSCWSCTIDKQSTVITHVLDDGFLLLRVLWPSNIKVKELFSKYVSIRASGTLHSGSENFFKIPKKFANIECSYIRLYNLVY